MKRHLLFQITCGMALALSAVAGLGRSTNAAPPHAPRVPILVFVQPPCTETEFDAAIAAVGNGGSGIIKFNCGSSPTYITLSSTKYVGAWFFNAPMSLEIDGEGLITLGMTGGAPPMFVVGGNFSAGLVLRNLTLRDTTNGVVQAQSGTLLVDNCDMLMNINTDVRAGMGGAIYNFNARVTVQNSRLYSNLANYGGAIYSQGIDLQIINSEIYSNTAYYQGGGMWITNTATINTARISGNQTIYTFPNGSGGGIYGGGALDVTNGNFYANQATGDDGGAIAWRGPGTLGISNTIFYTNTSALGGGALYLLGWSPNGWLNTYITATQFLTNSAPWRGGALWCETTCELKTWDSAFRGNRSYDGGAINMGDNTDSRIYRATFAGNAATHDGGAVNARGVSTFDVWDSTFSDNTSVGNGGAVIGRVPTFYNTQFLRNQAQALGGAICATFALGIQESTLQNNQAQGDGGAIFLVGAGNIKSSLLQQNSATRGGAISSNGGANVTVETSRLIANTASQDGGAIYRRYAGGLTVRRNEFSGNTAVGKGGALALANNTTPSIYESTFANNSAAQGGAFYTDGTHSTMYNLTFTGNSATQGGAVFADNSATLPFMNVTMVNNTASGSAGGVYSSGSPTITFHASLLDNPVGNTCNGFLTAYQTLATDSSCSGGGGLILTTAAALKLLPLMDNGGYWAGPSNAQVHPRTLLPGFGSSAIDALAGSPGNGDYAGSDQRGIARPQGAMGDAGAVEVTNGDPNRILYLPLLRR